MAHPRVLPFRDVSLENDKSTVDHTIDALDEELSALMQLTSAISAHRNRLASVHKLPAELLVRCFWWLSLIEPPKVTLQKPRGLDSLEDYQLPRQRDIGWMKVKQQSHYIGNSTTEFT